MGVGAFVLFIVPVTLIMHNFWAETGLAQIADLRAFMGNVGLLGSALMFLAIPQPWEMSLAGLSGALRAMTRKGRPVRAPDADNQCVVQRPWSTFRGVVAGGLG